MNVINWIRFILGVVFIIGGLVFFVIQFIGVFRFKYVLNRMHAGAIGDTLGLDLLLLGTIFLNGFDLAAVKIIAIWAFLWFTSPVAAHMVTKLEVLSKANMEECCPVENAEDISEEEV